MKPKPPCRLYAIKARQAPVAVLFRRGPSKHVQLIRWDTKNDVFEVGQWFRGRIYERRCDLSPSGRLLVYFAANWKGSPETHSWTAVSRPPYLSALALWFKGDAWCGGGLFKSDQELGLNNGGVLDFRLATDASSVPLKTFDLNLGRGEDDPIETTRETRDGWVLAKEMDGVEPPTPFDPIGYKTIAPRIVEKISGSRRLQRTEWLERYTLFRRYGVEGFDLDIGGVSWADWDQQQRLVFIREGKVFSASFSEGMPKIAQLADFSENNYVSTKSPEWARHW